MPKKVLVVDDEEDLVDVLETFLLSNGYKVFSAGTGEEGLECARTEDPDLIIMDIAMPGMSGLETLSALRRQRETAAVPVIMLSAHGQSPNIFEAQRHRAVEFLTKPFLESELIRSVRKHIR